MLDEAKRTTILTLAAEGRSRHVIAKAVGVSRNTVERVRCSGQAKPAPLPRAEQAAPFVAQTTALTERCEGNLVRVARGAGRQRGHAALLDADRLLPPPRHRRRAQGPHRPA